MDYQWDFGNGQISLDTTPASIIYNPSIFQDTTYFDIDSKQYLWNRFIN